MKGCAVAWAPINIAVVKYFGKANASLNIPANPSLAITLSKLGTKTSTCFHEALQKDVIIIDGKEAEGPTYERISRFLDLLRQKAGLRIFARVESANNIPKSQGLASSASGFAALALSATKALGLDFDLEGLSEVARRGSGSAPRSLLGGFVEHAVSEEGASRVRQIAPPHYWDVRAVIAMVSAGNKEVSSGEAMERARLTSPFFEKWLEENKALLEPAKEAILQRNMAALARVSERSCFLMHAVALSSWPPLVFFNDATMECYRRVRNLQLEGVQCCFTTDAGPHVVVLCEAKEVMPVVEALSNVKGVERILIDRPGEGARLVQD